MSFCPKASLDANRIAFFFCVGHHVASQTCFIHAVVANDRRDTSHESLASHVTLNLWIASMVSQFYSLTMNKKNNAMDIDSKQKLHKKKRYYIPKKKNIHGKSQTGRKQLRKTKNEEEKLVVVIDNSDGTNAKFKSKSKSKRRTQNDLKYQKALADELMEQAKSDTKKKSKKKKKKDSQSCILPEELAYKDSLKLQQKNHAKIAEKVMERQQVHHLVETKLSTMKQERDEKKRLLIIEGVLPEERAYRMSIGNNGDAAMIQPTTCMI